MASLKDVAKAAGYSVGTVSRVLNGRNKESWPSTVRRAEEIRRIAKSLGYRPDAAARAMRSRRTNHIGVLVRILLHEKNRRLHYVSSYEMIQGINYRLEQDGYLVSFVRIGEVKKGIESASAVFRERVLDGLILVAAPPEIEREVHQLIPHCVWLDSSVWRPAACLQRDEVHAGRTAAQALIDLGYRRLVWVGYHGSGHYSDPDRFEGVRDVARASGVVVEELRGGLAELGAERSRLERCLQPEVGVIAYDTLFVRRLLHLAGGLRRYPGHDFGLVCCDENDEITKCWPDLTRVTYDRFALGVKAAEMMLERLRDPDAPCKSQRVRGSLHPGTTARRMLRDA